MTNLDYCKLGCCSCAKCSECEQPVHGHATGPAKHEDGECPDWMDVPMPFAFPLQCANGRWETNEQGGKVKRGCTVMGMHGGPFPKTPRQYVKEAEEMGWTCELIGKKAKFTCKKCQA